MQGAFRALETSASESTSVGFPSLEACFGALIVPDYAQLESLAMEFSERLPGAKQQKVLVATVRLRKDATGKHGRLRETHETLEEPENPRA